ncbi:hypothetical protein D3C78_1954560 [compost metagenome]
MIYLKTEVDGKQQIIDIYDDEIYSTCFKCGKEFQVDLHLIQEILRTGGDFASTSVSCGCSVERPTLTLIK